MEDTKQDHSKEENDYIDVVILFPAQKEVQLFDGFAHLLSKEVLLIHVPHVLFPSQLKLQLHKFLQLLSQLDEDTLFGQQMIELLHFSSFDHLILAQLPCTYRKLLFLRSISKSSGIEVDRVIEVIIVLWAWCHVCIILLLNRITILHMYVRMWTIKNAWLSWVWCWCGWRSDGLWQMWCASWLRSRRLQFGRELLRRPHAGRTGSCSWGQLCSICRRCLASCCCRALPGCASFHIRGI